MKHRLLGLLLMVLSLWVTAASAQKAAPKKLPTAPKEAVAVHRIVMQVTTADTLEHKALLNNLKHLEEGWGDSVQIEVVVHGPGLEMVMKSKAMQEATIRKVNGKRVQFLVCRNTMKQKGVTDDQILPNLGFVDMGLGHIVRRQEQGWPYIKAGF